MIGVVATGLALVACGDADPSLEAARAEYPTGADDVVVRISSGGGFVPLEVSLAHLPEFTLYGDGQLVWVDYEGRSFPTAALPALRTTVLDDEQIQALLDNASRAGIADDNLDYGTPNITDVGGTSFAINVGGVQHTTSAYALGFGDESLTDTQVDWPFADLGTIPGSGTTSTPCLTLTGDEGARAVELAAGASSATPWVSDGKQYHLVFRPLLPDESGCDDLG